MPYGCEPNGKLSVWTTLKLAGLTMLIVPSRWLTTQIRPSAAIATLRGACPTAISVRRVSVTASNMLTESLSWLTTHSRELLPERVSYARFEDQRAAAGVSGK